MSTEHLMGVYNRAPLAVDRGQGARLWSTDGTERTQYRVVGFMKAAEFAAIATQATRSQPDNAGSTPGSTP